MKCIRCNTNNTLKQRKANGGKCVSCKEQFALEPTTDRLKLTDPRFKHAIDRATGQGKGVYFTERQLSYALDKTLPRFNPARFLVGVVAIVLLTLLLSSVFRFHIVPTFFVVMVVWVVGSKLWYRLLNAAWKTINRGPRGEYAAKIAPEQFAGYLRRWETAHGPIPKLLRQPADGWVNAGGSPTRILAEPDLSVYSFDRAVVTDNAETAAMLVANNFHFENDCAVLSYDGYPGAMAKTILEMLRRNEKLQVFCVHDASPIGCLLPLRMHGFSWFPDRGARILDLGLRPKHAKQLSLPIRSERSGTPAPELSQVLTKEEIAWLHEGKVAEVAALPPERMLRGIFRGMNRARQAAAQSDTDPQAATRYRTQPQRGSLSRWPLIAGAAALFAFLFPWWASRDAEASAAVDAGAFDPDTMLTEEELARRASSGSSGGSDGGSGFDFSFDWSDNDRGDVFAADSFG